MWYTKKRREKFALRFSSSAACKISSGRITLLILRNIYVLSESSRKIRHRKIPGEHY